MTSTEALSVSRRLPRAVTPATPAARAFVLDSPSPLALLSTSAHLRLSQKSGTEKGRGCLAPPLSVWRFD